jgi:hypothetical protein
MLAAGVIAGDEPAVDRWHRMQALDFIRTRPLGFLKGCVLRCMRFWSPVPNATNSMSPKIAVFAAGAFYVFVMAGLLLFGIRRFPRRWAIPFGLLLVSFSLVHSVFWSNARMMASVVPAIALLSACGWLPPDKVATGVGPGGDTKA